MSFDGELRNITKSYGSVHANQGVNVHVRSGTIHALIGENGAGKSTSMKVLFGLVKPDSGEILFQNKAVSHWNPQKAFEHGIGMVHQHFMLAGPESVHDNLVLGAETTRFGLRNRRLESTQLLALMQSTGLQVPLNKSVESLPVGLQSRCEILKVLYRNAQLLILDEPTAVLAPQEIEDFLRTLKILRDQGKTILIVTHKLKEVIAVADDATILRAGKTVATRKISETSVTELSELMVGRRLQMPRVSRNHKSGQTRLRLKTPEISLELRSHEITGIAGVEGNGQEELIEALIDPKNTKDLQLEIFGQNASEYSSKEIRKLPIAIIPADRHHEGLILTFNLSENLRLGREQVKARNFHHFRSATEKEKSLLKNFDVRPSDPTLPAQALSGGNQQKLIIARELSDLGANSIVIAVHPTRGVDLGAIEFIHNQLLTAADLGAAVLVISSELDELMALSHRIGVLYRKHLTEWFEGPPYDEHAIGITMLTGHAKHDLAATSEATV